MERSGEHSAEFTASVRRMMAVVFSTPLEALGSREHFSESVYTACMQGKVY
jgi:hypothetical protein